MKIQGGELYPDRYASPSPLAFMEEEQSLMAGLFRVYDNYLGVLRDSQIDRLTGLLNRHTFDEQLDRALGVTCGRRPG